MPRQFEALCLAAGQCRHRLPEPQVVKTHFAKRRQAQADLLVRGEEPQRFGNRHVEHVGDAHARMIGARQFALEHLGAIAAAVAIRAAQVHVGKELHFHMLEAVAATARTAPVAGIEAECPRGVLALARLGQSGKQFANGVEGAHVTRRIRARRASDPALIHHYHSVDELGAMQGAVRAGIFGGLALRAQQRRPETCRAPAWTCPNR